MKWNSEARDRLIVALIYGAFVFFVTYALFETLRRYGAVSC